MEKKTILKVVEWSEPDQLFIGYLRGLCTGGVCHGDDELKVHEELNEIADEWQELVR